MDIQQMILAILADVLRRYGSDNAYRFSYSPPDSRVSWGWLTVTFDDGKVIHSGIPAHIMRVIGL